MLEVAAQRLVMSVALLEESEISERWWHVFYPLAAEIAADRGDLPRTRSLADRYLGCAVHQAAEAVKLCVLAPLARAEVDAFLRGESSDESRGQGVVSQMEKILNDYPPLVQAWTSLLTPSQSLTFARAELSRTRRPEVDAWTRALHSADYAYYRTYAAFRLAEATIDSGQIGAAQSRLQQAFDEASRMRFAHLSRRIARVAQAAGESLR